MSIQIFIKSRLSIAGTTVNALAEPVCKKDPDVISFNGFGPQKSSKGFYNIRRLGREWVFINIEKSLAPDGLLEPVEGRITLLKSNVDDYHCKIYCILNFLPEIAIEERMFNANEKN